MGFVNCISSKDINGKTINLGTGNEYFGEQVLKIISNLMKINTSYKQDNKGLDQSKVRCIDLYRIIN